MNPILHASDRPLTLRQWLDQAEIRLAEINIEAPKLEAQILLAHAIRKNRTFLLAHPEDLLSDPHLADETLCRRLLHEPLAYILGYREFYGRHFIVTHDVLIPRQETEGLIDAVKSLVEGRQLSPYAKVIDVGCGSGCIGITLKLEYPSFQVVLTDISQPAIEIASQNCKALNAEVQLQNQDLLEGYGQASYDLIVSNPPYVATTDELPPEVKDFEPALALFAKENGLQIYRRLISQAKRVLNPYGFLVIELGKAQATLVQQICEAEGLDFYRLDKDLAGIDRILLFQKK